MRALVLSVGGLRGAYDAGVASALCRRLGHKYFDTIYMSSVGCFNGTFFASNQPDVMEKIWRDRVSGKQLVNYLNPLKGKNILDSEYLIDIFKTEGSKLDLEAIFSSGVKLVYVLENPKTGEAIYLEPTKANLFDVLLAGSATPVVHKSVKVDGSVYIDGSLADPIPYKRAFEDGHEEVIVIYNKPEHFRVGKLSIIGLWILSLFVPNKVGKQMRGLAKQIEKIGVELKMESRVTLIRPSFPMPFSIWNTDVKFINKIFDAGLEDGEIACDKILSKRISSPFLHTAHEEVSSREH